MELKEQPNVKTPEKAEEVEQFNETTEILLQSMQKIAKSFDLKFEEAIIKQDIHDTRNHGLVLEISFRHEDTDVKMKTIDEIAEKMKKLMAESKWKNSFSVYTTSEHKIEMRIDTVKLSTENRR